MIKTSVFLFNHPDTSLAQMAYDCFHGPRVLRPGQYHQATEVTSWREEADGDPSDLVGMGMSHDRR